MTNNNTTLIAAANMEAASREKSVGITYALLILFGYLGIHRFYMGNTGLGLLYLFTLGGLGVGLLIDLFLIPASVRGANYRIRSEVFARYGLIA